VGSVDAGHRSLRGSVDAAAGADRRAERSGGDRADPDRVPNAGGPIADAPVVVLDMRGWMSPAAAWEVGVDPERLVVVRCPDPKVWPQVAAALCEGVSAMYAEVPVGVREQDLRRLAALIRARQMRAVLRPLQGDLPTGVAHLRMRAVEVIWEGVAAGHGRLGRRRLVLEISGKGAAGITRRIEVEDAGENAVRVVSGLGVVQSGRAV
jgi:hypothetical protein